MPRGVHWFRNDLRLRDNTALAALQDRVDEWVAIFVLDPRLEEGAGVARKSFFFDCLERLSKDLAKQGVPLLVRRGQPDEVLPQLLHELGATRLSFSRDTTPFASRRDDDVRRRVEKDGCDVITRVDHVVFEADEVLTGKGRPFAVYTPYRNAWWKRWRESPRRPIRMPRLRPAIPGLTADAVPELEPVCLANAPRDLPTGGERAAKRRLARFLDGPVARYHEDRDRPDLDGTSRLSPYLRFGVLSVRECFERAAEAVAFDPRSRQGAQKWLDELIWRDFYAAILQTHPRVTHSNHRSEYDAMRWNEDPDGFEAWCQGRTGFPIVDAGMIQLRETGWMHNRVRMIVASFLTKDLLIHWRAGERYFFDRLVDGDPASNNGGWQWAASTGTDAQPYFRIYNPTTQGQRWDPEGRYVRRWLPSLRSVPDPLVHSPWKAPLLCDYPEPIVDHAERRVVALDRFKAARALAGVA